MKASKFNQIIGELILCTPAFVISLFFDLWFECVVGIISLLMYKPMYEYGYHSDKGKEYVCIIISYVTILISCAIGFLFKGEYYIIIVFSNIIAFANCHIGLMQYKAERFEIIKEPYTTLKQRYEVVNENSVETLINKGLSARQADLYIAKYINKIKGEKLIDYMLDKGYDFSKSTCDREIRAIKDTLNL